MDKSNHNKHSNFVFTPIIFFNRTHQPTLFMTLIPNLDSSFPHLSPYHLLVFCSTFPPWLGPFLHKRKTKNKNINIFFFSSFFLLFYFLFLIKNTCIFFLSFLSFQQTSHGGPSFPPLSKYFTYSSQIT